VVIIIFPFHSCDKLLFSNEDNHRAVVYYCAVGCSGGAYRMIDNVVDTTAYIIQTASKLDNDTRCSISAEFTQGQCQKFTDAGVKVGQLFALKAGPKKGYG
jgi:hypothetical protein